MVVAPLGIPSISHIARVSGLHRYVVRTLIDHYGIEVTESSGNRLTLVKHEDLPRLIEVLERHPGVIPGFADRL